MDAKRLIELARDCGMFVTTEMRWQIERWERLAAAVTDEIATPAIVVEREACAKMCEQLSHIGSENQLWMRDRCVAAIRSRSNSKSQAAAPQAQVACTDGLGGAVPPAPTFEGNSDGNT